MLTLLQDPAGLLGRKRFAWDHSRTIHENIELHLPHGGGCKVFVNAIEVDPANDPCMEQLASIAHQVTVVRRPEGLDPISWLYIAYAALAVYTLASLSNRPTANTSSVGKDSPNNQLTGQTNVARAYQAIPDVYGYRRVWPDLIQPSTVEYIDNLKYVTEWLCISRGRGTISDVQYAETPISDINGASYEIFEPTPTSGYPEHSTTTLLDVLETFASDEVDGQELPPGVIYPPVAPASSVVEVLAGETTFTIEVPDTADLAILKSLVPAGLAQVNFLTEAGSGGIDGSPDIYFDQVCSVTGFTVAGGLCTFSFSSTTVWEADDVYGGATITPQGSTTTTMGPYTLPVTCSRIRWNTVFLRGLKGTVTVNIEYWQINGAGAEIGGTRASRNDSYSANTFDQQFFTREVIPAAGSGRYRVQFRRITPQIDDGAVDVAKIEEVYAVRHYPTKVLPGVTAFRVTTKATEEATGFKDRKFNVRWLRHVRGIYGGTAVAPSRSFMRAFAHMWVIAGNDLAELDLERLAAIETEFGDTGPLVRFDASLDDADMSLGERMQLAADMGRCQVWRDGQKWTVTRTQSRPWPDLQLDYRNLAAGGESAISYSAHLPASNDGVEVEYIDEGTQAKKSYVRINISSGAVVYGQSANPMKVKLTACATAAQADNRAQLEARKLLYQRVSVSDTAMNDAATLGLGACIRWIDPNDFAGDDGLQAGEVMEIAGSIIATSEPLDWKGETEGRILFTGVNGQQLGAPVICTPLDGGLVQLASVPAGLYVADATRQLGSRYAFAVGLTSAEVESQGLYTVTSLKPDASGNYPITFVEYDERVFDGD